MEAMLKLKEMPKSCDDCPICVEGEWCPVTNNHVYGDERREDCPLVYIKRQENKE